MIKYSTGCHPGCQNLGITHLSFADDLLVFSDGSKRSIEEIIKVFDKFACISGLKISIEKSTIFLVGLSDEARRDITSRFPFSTGSLPVRYLGLPLLTKRMTANDYCPLVEKIRSRLLSWKTRLLSFAGRLQLLNSVITSIVNFWLSAFRLPNGCITKLEKLFSAFLWDGPSLNSRKTKLAWHEVCHKKSEGGLGIRRLKDTNKILCLKLIWRILSADSLWVDWIKESLIQKASFWSVPDRNSGSWIWRKLLKYRDVAKDFHRVEIGNGESVSFWFDAWSELGCLWDLVGDRGTIDLGIPKEATISEIRVNRRRRIHRVLVLNDIEDALSVARQSTLVKDMHKWKNSIGVYKGSYSTKETWECLRVVQPKLDCSVGIWFKQATPKFSFLVWLAVRNRLSTGDRMSSWNINANSSCGFCNGATETIPHLFFACSYSSEIWSLLAKGVLYHKFTTSWSGLLQVIADDSQDYVLKFLIRYLFQASVHTIWLERNRRRHGATPVTPQGMSAMINTMVKNRISSIRTQDSKMENAMQRWLEAID